MEKDILSRDGVQRGRFVCEKLVLFCLLVTKTLFKLILQWHYRWKETGPQEQANA